MMTDLRIFRPASQSRKLRVRWASGEEADVAATSFVTGISLLSLTKAVVVFGGEREETATHICKPLNRTKMMKMDLR